LKHRLDLLADMPLDKLDAMSLQAIHSPETAAALPKTA